MIKTNLTMTRGRPETRFFFSPQLSYGTPNSVSEVSPIFIFFFEPIFEPEPRVISLSIDHCYPSKFNIKNRGVILGVYTRSSRDDVMILTPIAEGQLTGI